jgi:Ca2+-dependent lipid-binding protein
MEGSILYITVNSGSNLGKGDCYVVLKLQNQYNKTTSLQGGSPFWKEKFSLDIMDLSQPIIISVYNKEAISMQLL